MKLLFRTLLDTLFPPLCHHCKGLVAETEAVHLCADCRMLLRFIDRPLCLRCGRPFCTSDGMDHLCGSCSLSPPPFAAARAALEFAGPVRELVHRFKYGKKEYLSRPLALLAAEQLQEFAASLAADIVIPVPLHRRRLRERGFNQALLLADLLARTWRVPLMRHNLRRVRWTEPQIGLAAADRAGNVRGAFAVNRPAEVTGRRILLIDDVYTTGSTVAECARVLKKAGAAEISVVTVARAIADHPLS